MICWTGEPSRPSGDVGPVAAGVLADEDLARCRRRSARCRHRGSCRGCRRPPGHRGRGRRRPGRGWCWPGVPKVAGRADVEPGLALVRGLEDVAGARADEQVLDVDRVDHEVGELVAALVVHVADRCVRPGSRRFGGGLAVAGLEQPEGPADAVDLDEISVLTALAGRPELEEGAAALLVDGGARGVEHVLPAGPPSWTEVAPHEIAVGDQVGVGGLAADVLGAGVEQRLGGLGRRAARLGRDVIELGELEVAVAIDRRGRRRCRAADGGLERPVVVQDAVDPVDVADDQPRQPGRRVDLGEGDLVAGAGDLVIRAPGRLNRPVTGDVHRRQGGAVAGVGEGWRNC